MKNAVSVDESRLYLGRGGPSYRLMQRVGVIRGEGSCVMRRIVCSIAVTWIPLFVLSVLQGRALGPTPRESFLLDFATYARFFLALPTIIAAEPAILPRLAGAGVNFVRSGLVREDEYPAFEEAVAQVQKRVRSVWAEIVMLGLVVFSTWAAYQSSYATRAATWQIVAAAGGGARFSLAGVWYNIIAIPLLQFMMYRWLWRLIIWGGFLHSMSRLNLRIVSTHPDQAGGLGFLGTTQVAFTFLIMGLGTILSAEAAFQIVFEGATIQSFRSLFATYLILSELIFLGPLLVFSTILARKRREGLQVYGALAIQYNYSFQEKWVEGKAPEGEQLMGSSDIQSLADLGNSYQMIKDMRLIPFSPRMLLQMTVMACFPWLPLFPLVMPVDEILKVLGGVLF